jgi:hypothetical protein
MKILQIFRGFKQNLPKLFLGELAYTKDTNGLYVGTEEGNKLLNIYDFGA